MKTKQIKIRNKKALILIVLFASFASDALAQYKFDKPLYGASYYYEYMPMERLDEDVKMMKEAGVSVVRVGESTWGVFEPQDGEFHFEWMDKVIDKMHKAGIKVIFGTPTYSLPAWLANKHPELLAEYTGGRKAAYGARQNMNISDPLYRKYCERIIRKIMERYAKHPAIIGWQIDNETEPRNINNENHFQNFKKYVMDKFDNSLDSINHAWGLNYWGMNLGSWDDFYRRDGVSCPSYKNEWERYYRIMVAEFLNWQCDIINEYKRPDQFVTHDFMTAYANVDQIESSRQMEYPGINIYHEVQDGQNGWQPAYGGDYFRTMHGGCNYLVMETNAQGIGWDSRGQHPPYDGQLRQNLYSHLASGANLVMYWHWATLHYGQETFWKGLLGHDLKPNRVYDEFASTAHELDKIGSRIVNLKKKNKAAILFSHDSEKALDFMPYADRNYQLDMAHWALYMQNIEADIISCDNGCDLSNYDLIVVPSLYVATDELLNTISEFTYRGGHVVMLPKSGYCNEHSAARATLAPGPLRKAAGFYYQEYSNIGTLRLKGDPLNVGNANNIYSWLEFLIPETAKPLAYADHHFFGKWPAITENSYGKGKFTYIATIPSQEILDVIVRQNAVECGIATSETPRFPLIIRKGFNSANKQITYLFNYSKDSLTAQIPEDKCKDIISGKSYSKGDTIILDPWGVVILEEK